MLACCGLDCAACDARTATLRDDNALRAKVATEWSLMNNAAISAAQINCTGCRAPGVKFAYCEQQCPIRRCAMEAGHASCADCADWEHCAHLREIHRHAPEARERIRLARGVPDHA